MGDSSGKEQYSFLDEDFCLDEEDVITEVLDSVSTILFSDRVQQFIERRMARIVIVKLLGGRIGFNVLLNKITLV